jgi:hypothetical protein
LSRSKRVVLTLYGVALAFIFVWIPWRGYQTPIYQAPRERWQSTLLGYGPVWSQLKPPAAYSRYEASLAAYRSAVATTPIDLSAGFVTPPKPPPGYVEVPPPKEAQPVPAPQAPKEPNGYMSTRIYRWARVDYGRILLEFGTVTSLSLVAWLLVSAEERTR